MYYVLTYQRGFAYEVMSNMNTASNKPLYDINSLTNKKKGQAEKSPKVKKNKSKQGDKNV